MLDNFKWIGRYQVVVLVRCFLVQQPWRRCWSTRRKPQELLLQHWFYKPWEETMILWRWNGCLTVLFLCFYPIQHTTRNLRFKTQRWSTQSMWCGHSRTSRWYNYDACTHRPLWCYFDFDLIYIFLYSHVCRAVNTIYIRKQKLHAIGVAQKGGSNSQGKPMNWAEKLIAISNNHYHRQHFNLTALTCKTTARWKHINH